jgi:hypothetical protein
VSDDLYPASALPQWAPSPGAERDPARIDVLLKQIEVLWKEHPEQRLCQLLCNLLDPEPNRLFYVEDHVVSEKIIGFRQTGLWAKAADDAPSDQVAVDPD